MGEEELKQLALAAPNVREHIRGREITKLIVVPGKLVNDCYRLRRDGASPPSLRFALATAASLVFPFAPHTAADAYDRLTGERVWEQPWPDADPALLERDTYELVCQVNGKLRDRIQVASGLGEEELKALALASPKVREHVEGHDIIKTIVIVGKLVNVVVR